MAELDISQATTPTATTDYSSKIVCSVEKDNLFGTQFHPEKSDKTGLKIIDNFFWGFSIAFFLFLSAITCTCSTSLESTAWYAMLLENSEIPPTSGG